MLETLFKGVAIVALALVALFVAGLVKVANGRAVDYVATTPIVCQTQSVDAAVISIWKQYSLLPAAHLKGEAAQAFVDQTGGLDNPQLVVSDALLWAHTEIQDTFLAAAFVGGCLYGSQLLPLSIVNKFLERA